MTDIVYRTLGLDRVNLAGHLIVISEHHGSDANFLINTILSKSLENGYGVELVLFHNTFGHYHNIGMKLGYNLNVLRERGDVVVVEPMKSIVSNIEELGHDSVDASSVEFTDNTRQLNSVQTMPNPLKFDERLVQHLFTPVRDQYLELKKLRPNVIIIVDDITHLFNLNISREEIWHYSKCIISLMTGDRQLAICMLGHTYKANVNKCYSNRLTNVLMRMSHLSIGINPLRTGYSDDVSGTMSVNWKVPQYRILYNWPEETQYFYTLTDRQIKLFTLHGLYPIS